MSNKLKSLLAQVNAATQELLANIQNLDGQIAALQEKRERIGEAPVSKADFLSYIEKELDRNTGTIKATMGRWLDQMPKDFFTLERSTLYIPFLTGTKGVAAEITEAAAYWYLKPAIMDRMAGLVELMEFPSDAFSIEERRKILADIDADIERLNGERDELASQMEAAGISS